MLLIIPTVVQAALQYQLLTADVDSCEPAALAAPSPGIADIKNSSQ